MKLLWPVDCRCVLLCVVVIAGVVCCSLAVFVIRCVLLDGLRLLFAVYRLVVCCLTRARCLLFVDCCLLIVVV